MQETPPAPSYPDWSTSMQAYYGAGATPFFASTVASPTPHPYMWGSQHPLIPPYGTPIPYPAIYPPGGVYAHPSMAMTPGAVHANMELDEKTPDGKEQVLAKKSKGTSGLKAGESGKTASGSGNDGGTLSAESGSEGSSEASDENTNQKESAATKKGSFDLMLVDGANAPNSPVDANLSASVQGKPVASVPATNLNIGMELWTPPAGVGAVKTRQNPTGAATPPTMIGREASGPDHQWIQDERELKRQKRKQSNRESARRSRLRKQAECEELQARVENLNNENHTLRDELQTLSDECQKLKSENNSIKDELTRVLGPDALSNLESGNCTAEQHSGEGEGNS